MSGEIPRQQYEITPARPDDAAAIGQLRATNWTIQYAGQPGVTLAWMAMETTRISSPDSNAERARWIDVSNQPGAASYWRVARLPDGLIGGFIEARRRPDGGQELHSLHVGPGQQRTGIGQALMDLLRKEWEYPGVPTYLDVAAINTRAQAFYARKPNGYELTNQSSFHGPICTLRMIRRAIL